MAKDFIVFVEVIARRPVQNLIVYDSKRVDQPEHKIHKDQEKYDLFVEAICWLLRVLARWLVQTQASEHKQSLKIDL